MLSPSVFQQRIEKLKNILGKKQIDAFIFFKPENISYLTGFAEEGMLFIDKKDTIIFVNFCLFHQYQKQTTFAEVILSGSLLNSLNKICRKKRFRKIAAEDDFISYQQYKMIKEKIKINIISQKNILEKIRQIKDMEEIEIIRKACEITDKGFSHILNFIKEGVREYEISAELEYFLKNNYGIKKFPFPTIVAGGYNSAFPHYTAGDYKIKYSDCILIDFGVIFLGYCSDMTRTVFLGKIDNEKKKIYDAVRNAQSVAIDEIREGKKCKEIDRIAREYLKNKGLAKYFGHNLGHGVGKEIHETPSLSSKDKTKIKRGMILTVEPGVYLPKEYGIRIEDMILIKEKDIELLTKSSKKIIII